MHEKEVVMMMYGMDSSSGSQSRSQHPQLPPGFRFHPTDEELVVHYLKRKAASAPLPVAIIADVDLYKFDPWELPSTDATQRKATFGEQEWYFFSPRDRKYPNGARPNRAATSGYWKATGTDKPILASDGKRRVGVKKALVFYGGKPPKGVKTNWIMHEYRLADTPSNPPPHKNSFRLDDWVLCRIYKKSNGANLPRPPLMGQGLPVLPTLSMPNTASQNSTPSCSRSASYGPLGLENDDNFFDGIVAAAHDPSVQNGSDSQIASSNSKGNFVMKREIPSSRFWNDPAGSPASSSSSKRLHCDLNTGSNTADENTSFLSLLSQLPHTTTFPPLDSGELRQQFQLPSMNWN